jgi:hypothetical protein
MSESFVLRLDEIQPSQLYLNEAKVASVKEGAGRLARCARMQRQLGAGRADKQRRA